MILSFGITSIVRLMRSVAPSLTTRCVSVNRRYQHSPTFIGTRLSFKKNFTPALLSIGMVSRIIDFSSSNPKVGSLCSFTIEFGAKNNSRTKLTVVYRLNSLNYLPSVGDPVRGERH